MTSLINCLGNTKVLSREVEGKLTGVIRKGVRMEEAVAAREEQLKRPMTLAEIAEMQVGASFQIWPAMLLALLSLVTTVPSMVVG